MNGWVRGLWRRSVPRPALPERPVLVGGSPKSGTTAIAKLLGVATAREVASDPFNILDERGVDFRDALYGGRKDIAVLIDEHPDVFAAPIIKDPNFVFFVRALLARFPGAPFVFIVRDPRANVRSILNRLGIDGDASPEEVESRLPEMSEGWRRVLSGRTPDVGGSTFIECLANRWNAAVDAYLEHRERVRLVTYEAFDADKEGVIARLATDAGLETVRPLGAAADRQYQPRGHRGVAWSEFFGEANLRTIERTCAERMAALGYEPQP